MNRSIAFALVITLVQSSIAFAGESLIASATRVVRETTAQPASQPNVESRAGFPVVTVAARTGVRESAPKAEVLAQTQGGGTVSQGGMGKRTKWMIYAGAIAAFVGTAYAIDHSVKDVTPSSLGTRED
jgi:tartrate dehydratase beta subunit/fumarate hydratase class I family protein